MNGDQLARAGGEVSDTGKDWEAIMDAARLRYRRLGAYHRRIAGHHTRSSKWRAGTKANKHRRTVPTFASDLGESR